MSSSQLQVRLTAVNQAHGEAGTVGKLAMQRVPETTTERHPAMAVQNAEIARAFEEIADLLEIRDENPFRIRAYRNAARVVAELPWQVVRRLGEGESLPKIPGIGVDLAGKIREIATTGRCTLLERLRSQTTPALVELLRLPSLGPKRVRLLHDELGIDSLNTLREALQSGRVQTLHGFGERTATRLLEAIDRHVTATKRHLLADVDLTAGALVAYLHGVAGVSHVAVAGSARRMRETVGDLDVLTTAANPGAVSRAFCDFDQVASINARGRTRSSVVLRSGLQVDLRVVPDVSYGAALLYFTGSKAHNIALRRIAVSRGLKLNEYGVFHGRRRIAGDTEESVYAAIGLPYIEPEMREDAGEIDAAMAGRLPALVTRAQLRGDLHTHSNATDGRNSVREMAEAARREGLAYIAITDHSKRLTVAHGLDAHRLTNQVEEIRRLNRTLQGVVVLSGVEADVLEDGRLDLPDALLARLDIVVAAVHSQFGLARERQTERVLRVLDNPHVRILAHPSGRLLHQREPCELDWDRVLRRAGERDIAVEVNAQPSRLDLTDERCRLAKAHGVRVAINSDAHACAEFAFLRYGVGQARRGWLEASDVVNTLPLGELVRWLRRDRNLTREAATA